MSARATRIVAAAALWLVALALRGPLEADPLTHVLVQLTMLGAAGWALAPLVALGRGDWNRGGWACLILAIAAMAIWMLPRSIDAALADPRWEAAKFVTLPFLVGLPLGLGWARAHPLLRAVLRAQCLSMLGVLAFLYTHAPLRLCNAYLVEDQQRLGLGFLALALALAAGWALPLFRASAVPSPRHKERLA
ncbi:MAG: hypothetical protein CVT70_15245 [Alphaproteobacteria bacterium HGW-Alphaproteobacteria-1]|jgi:hypothetical protein|nr:MAG: hypothetical protein CVT70_15245 [Alphaproteobacteria bacterium HGW-Alphaproteobacteria-1]